MKREKKYFETSGKKVQKITKTYVGEFFTLMTLNKYQRGTL